MEGLISFDIVTVTARNVKDTDKLGASSRADIDDEFVEVLHDEVESHASAALFLFDLIIAHAEASGHVGANFFGCQGTEAVTDGDNELLSVTREGEETRFVGLKIDGNGTKATSVGANTICVDRCVIDGVHEEFVGDAAGGGNDAFIDANAFGVIGQGLE